MDETDSLSSLSSHGSFLSLCSSSSDSTIEDLAYNARKKLHENLSNSNHLNIADAVSILTKEEEKVNGKINRK